MKQASLEHIEAKVMNFLHDTKSPRHASQIAVHIQEKREDTLYAIQQLVKNQTIKNVQDFSLFDATGETTAYRLVDGVLQAMPVAPSIPMQSAHSTPPAPRDSAPGSSA